MKIFKNIMLAVALFAMNAVSAKQIGGVKAQPARVTSTASQEKMLSAQQEEALRQEQLKQDAAERKAADEKVAEEKRLREQSKGAPSATAEMVSSKEWNAIVKELTSGDKIPSKNRINQIKQMNLTNEQIAMLSIIEQNIILKRQLVAEKAAKEKEKQKRKQPAKGWFSGWLGGEAGSIESYKNMIVAKLDDAEKYPTLKSKQEALDLGIEFFEPEYIDQNIMKKAEKALKAEFSKESETPEQTQINKSISKMRQQFGFDLEDLNVLPTEEKITYLKEYLRNNKAGMKDFVKQNITNDNVKALLQAIISETERMNAMIDSLSGKGIQKQSAQQPVQRQVMQKEVAAPQKEVTDESEIISPWALGLRSLYGESQPATTSSSTTAPVQQTPIRAPQGRPAGGQ